MAEKFFLGLTLEPDLDSTSVGKRFENIYKLFLVKIIFYKRFNLYIFSL